METYFPPADQPATPEYILAVLRDMHRQQCQYDGAADCKAPLSFHSTVAEWRTACDLVDWRELGQACNEIWGICVSDDDWRAVLEPAYERRLTDVCALIARHSRRPVVRPARLFGCTCLPAGAFLTVRSLLHAAGVPAEQIAPSTPLAPFTRRYFDTFLGPISRLAPGSLPLVRIHTPVYDAAMWGILAGIACCLIGAYSGIVFLTLVGIVMYFAAYSLSWVAARSILPSSVVFGELQTFRDLAVILAGASASASGDESGEPRDFRIE